MLSNRATSVVSNATASILVTFATPSGVLASLAYPSEAAMPSTVPMNPTEGIAQAVYRLNDCSLSISELKIRNCAAASARPSEDVVFKLLHIQLQLVHVVHADHPVFGFGQEMGGEGIVFVGDSLQQCQYFQPSEEEKEIGERLDEAFGHGSAQHHQDAVGGFGGGEEDQ